MFIKTYLNETFRIESIITLHYFEYTKDFNFAGEAHDFWEMVYVDFGEVVVVADSSQYILEKGEAYFHQPNEYHGICSNNTFSGVTIITFESHSDAMNFFVDKRVKLTNSQKQHVASVLEEGSRTFVGPLNIVEQDRLVLSSDAPFGSEQLIKTHIEQLLIDIVRCNSTLPERVAASKLHEQSEGSVVEKINEILHENLFGHISLDQLSNQIGYSKSYLKTLFKNSTGMSIMQMFLKMKINHAKKLISEQSHSVTEISQILGFNSVHYFSRVFKKVTGVTPSDYSKSVRRKALL